ncbi:MAG: hypothetical protein P1V97_17010 [Planctomycetota bacterium]|nr:hypothetical protein [Planctomycetota bacterium]
MNQFRGNKLGLLVLALSLVGCGSGGGSGQRTFNSGAVSPGSSNSGVLTTRLITRDSTGAERSIFSQGEAITLVLSFNNGTAGDVQFVAPDGCGLVNHLIEDRFAAQPSPVFNRLAGAICTQALVTHTIPAGQTREFSFDWDQTDSRGAQVRDGNYLFVGDIRDTGNFPNPQSISVDIGSNKLRVTGTAINNGIIASRTLVKVGSVQVQVNQSAGQNSLSTANAIATMINNDPAFNCSVVDLGSDVAELTVNLTGANPSLYQPVLFDLNSNDPVQRVIIP